MKNLFLYFVLVIVLSVRPVQAQSVIRDAEIEKVLQDISYPVFAAADLTPENISVYIINDPSLNAYVAGGQNLFLHTGLISWSDDPHILLGVIAHEAGHIAGGHLARTGAELEKATVGATLGYVLGLATALAGSPEAAQAIIAGSQHATQRNFLKYTRGHEESADQAALSYLDSLGLSARGLLTLLNHLHHNEKTLYGELNPYARTHPISQARANHIEHHTTLKTSGKQELPSQLQRRYAHMNAKLRAFLEPYEKTLERYPLSDTSDNAHYARAIAYYKIPDLDKSLREIDSLIKQHPQNAYYHELKGQILYENGRINEAIGAYEKANELLRHPLILIGLANSYIAMEEEQYLPEAIELLQQATTSEPANLFAWNRLAIAYGRHGELAQSNLSLAEASLLKNQTEEAEKFISLAKEHIVADSIEELHYQDLATAIKQQKKKN